MKRPSTRGWVLLLALAGCVGTETSNPTPPSGNPAILSPFTLLDQEDVTHTYPGSSERPLLLIHGDSETAASNTDWDHWIRDSLADSVQVHRVVDLSSVPGPFAFIARRRIREGADPKGIPILLDWEGALAAELGLAEERTTVIVVSRSGRILGRVEGERTEELQARVFELLSNAEAEGTP